jgi:hypothetical protein
MIINFLRSDWHLLVLNIEVFGTMLWRDRIVFGDSRTGSFFISQHKKIGKLLRGMRKAFIFVQSFA